MLSFLTLAAGLFFFYKEGNQQKGYQEGDRPEAAAYNYLMALARKDFSLAYVYLSPSLPGFPVNLDAFIGDLEEGDLLPAYEIDPCVYVENTDVFQGHATIDLRLQYYDPCLKGWWLEIQNLSQTPGQLKLVQEGGNWKIIGADDWFFFDKCWSDLSICE
jgi:hypothetical protein